MHPRQDLYRIFKFIGQVLFGPYDISKFQRPSEHNLSSSRSLFELPFSASFADAADLRLTLLSCSEVFDESLELFSDAPLLLAAPLPADAQILLGGMTELTERFLVPLNASRSVGLATPSRELVGPQV